MTLHSSIGETIENFSLFDDWEERYRYLIDLGRKLPAMDESLKSDENMVQGCTSRVWMQADVTDDVFHFTADSDAHIVRGLIALLVVAYQDKKLSEIPSINIEEMFTTIGLDQHLSPNRRSGFFAMVERIKGLASETV